MSTSWVVRIMQAGPTPEGRRITQTSLHSLLPLLPWAPIACYPAAAGGFEHLPGAVVRQLRVLESRIVGHLVEPQLLRDAIYARAIVYDGTPLACTLARADRSPLGLSAMTFARENADGERIFTELCSVDAVTVAHAGGAFLHPLTTGEQT